jgi:hypothetical protein
MGRRHGRHGLRDLAAGAGRTAVKQGIGPADVDHREVRSELEKRGAVLRV